jgi:release factor glutamine methyltransferase
MVLSVGAALRAATATLAAAPGAEPEGARAEAEILLAHVLGRGRTWLFTRADDAIDADAAATFEALVARRRAGEPVAYLVGQRGFWRFDLEVTPDTLIPRADTERLVELALERLPSSQPLRLLDLGTGTGAIALALAFERPRASVIAVDLSPGAAAVARRNADRLGLAERVAVREGAWFAPVPGEVFDLIASNPPYIEAEDPHLGLGDLRFEPPAALASGLDGLDDLRAIVRDAPAHLRPGGCLLVEHGWRQGGAVRALFHAAGFVDVETALDLEGRDRVTLGRWGG